jgi:hypothetical protein
VLGGAGVYLLGACRACVLRVLQLEIGAELSGIVGFEGVLGALLLPGGDSSISIPRPHQYSNRLAPPSEADDCNLRGEAKVLPLQAESCSHVTPCFHVQLHAGYATRTTGVVPAR